MPRRRRPARSVASSDTESDAHEPPQQPPSSPIIAESDRDSSPRRRTAGPPPSWRRGQGGLRGDAAVSFANTQPSHSATHHSVASDIQFLLNSVQKAIEDACSFGLDLSEAGLSGEFENTKETVKESIRLHKKLEQVSSAYTHVSSLINSVNLSAYTEATPNLAQTLFSPAINQCVAAARDRSLPKVTWSREKQFVEFCESAWELGPGRGNTLPMPSIASSAVANDDDDNDDIEVFSRMSLTCPVTLLPLKDPVRNPRCGHLYSRQGISSLITSTSYAIQCPVGGCSGTVTLQALVPDRRAETLLKRLEENIYFFAESSEPLLAGGGNTQQMTQFTSQK